MSSKRQVRKRCEAKVSYASEGAARVAATWQRSVGSGILHAYRCSLCRQWHTGHRPQTRHTVRHR